DRRARSLGFRKPSRSARLAPRPGRSGPALRRRNAGRGSGPLVVSLHELLPALAAVARVLDREVVAILALEPVRVAPLALRRGAAKHQGVSVPGPARGSRRRMAHAVEPVPDGVVRLRVPAEDAVPLEDGLAILLLDVIGDDEEAVEIDLAVQATRRGAARSPRRRAQLLLSHPVPGETVQSQMMFRGLWHL